LIDFVLSNCSVCQTIVFKTAFTGADSDKANSWPHPEKGFLG